LFDDSITETVVCFLIKEERSDQFVIFGEYVRRMVKTTRRRTVHVKVIVQRLWSADRVIARTVPVN
jgi:hypothetical protein